MHSDGPPVNFQAGLGRFEISGRRPTAPHDALYLRGSIDNENAGCSRPYGEIRRFVAGIVEAFFPKGTAERVGLGTAFQIDPTIGGKPSCEEPEVCGDCLHPATIRCRSQIDFPSPCILCFKPRDEREIPRQGLEIDRVRCYPCLECCDAMPK